jgi:hypothetical protein
MANKLEAILLLTTSREIDNGQFAKFLCQFEGMSKTSLSFVINVNNYTHTTDIESLINQYTSIFKYVEVNYLNIPKEHDLYIVGGQIDKKILPELGTCSGPNILFLESIRYCSKFDTILLLETDCILKKECFCKAEKFINNYGDFLICGARYDGTYFKNFIDRPALLHHINGVAFYKTCSPEFQGLINKVELFIIEQVRTKIQFFPYDVAISTYFYESDRLLDHNNKVMFRKINTTTLIINLSPRTDSYLTLEYVNGHYPNHIILHKKF